MQWDQAVDRAWIVTRIAQPALRGQVSLRTILLEGFVAIHARSGVSREAPAGPVQAVAQSVGMIAEPHCWILAVPDLVDSRLSVADRELLGAGRRIADANRGALAVLVCATATPDGMAEAGADRVLPAIDPRFTGYAAELRCAAAMAAFDLLAPRHVVFPDTPTNGGDTGRRLGAELDERPTAAVHTVSADFTVATGARGRQRYSAAAVSPLAAGYRCLCAA